MDTRDYSEIAIPCRIVRAEGISGGMKVYRARRIDLTHPEKEGADVVFEEREGSILVALLSGQTPADGDLAIGHPVDDRIATLMRPGGCGWIEASPRGCGNSALPGTTVKIFKGGVLFAEGISDATGKFKVEIAEAGSYELEYSRPDRFLPATYTLAATCRLNRVALTLPPNSDHVCVIGPACFGPMPVKKRLYLSGPVIEGLALDYIEESVNGNGWKGSALVEIPDCMKFGPYVACESYGPCTAAVQFILQTFHTQNYWTLRMKYTSCYSNNFGPGTLDGSGNPQGIPGVSGVADNIVVINHGGIGVSGTQVPCYPLMLMFNMPGRDFLSSPGVTPPTIVTE